GVALVLVGWCICAPLIAGALRSAAPDLPARRGWLIGLGWPACMVFGLGIPIALRLSYQGALLLGVGVAAAGLLAALALAPPAHPTPWDRVLLVVAAWCAGWLWPGVTAWPVAFFRLTNGYDNTFSEAVPFPLLAAVGLLSGLTGGVALHLVLGPNALRRV